MTQNVKQIPCYSCFFEFCTQLLGAIKKVNGVKRILLIKKGEEITAKNKGVINTQRDSYKTIDYSLNSYTYSLILHALTAHLFISSTLFPFQFQGTLACLLA